ncbi:MAG: hypothetical protein Ta2B_02710 [Termitinemataceae bacterium]|nr:MAG: hypothetical protein Ta2B_02710 [Termitinemataceae bacterium]
MRQLQNFSFQLRSCPGSVYADKTRAACKIEHTILDIVLQAGFVAAGLTKHDDAPLLVCALPYGNIASASDACILTAQQNLYGKPIGIVAPFARFNYYREAVKRLQKVSQLLRGSFGGTKSDYRIFCNSSINEKQAAENSGIGCLGRNNLIITKKAGSLVVIAAMTLPIDFGITPTSTAGGSVKEAQDTYRCLAPYDSRLFEARGAVPPTFKICECCKNKPLCAAACPTGAINGAGKIDLQKCIQWYASGNGGSVPKIVLENWGNVFYGCTRCLDACPHNKKIIAGAFTNIGGVLPFVDVKKITEMSDAQIKTTFKGTTLGLSWLGPSALRRNARCVMHHYAFALTPS